MKGGFQLQEFINKISDSLNDDCLNKGEILDMLHYKLKDYMFVDYDVNNSPILRKSSGGDYSAQYKLKMYDQAGRHIIELVRVKAGNESFAEMVEDSFIIKYNKNLIRYTGAITTENACIAYELEEEHFNDRTKYNCELKGYERSQAMLGLVHMNSNKSYMEPYTFFANGSDDHYTRTIRGTMDDVHIFLRDIDGNTNQTVNEYNFQQSAPIFNTINQYINSKEVIKEIDETVANDFVKPSKLSF